MFTHTYSKPVLLDGEIAHVIIAWRAVNGHRTGPTRGTRAFTKRANRKARRR